MPSTGDAGGGPADAPGLRPVPDPSVLTTEQLHREISSLQKLLEMRDDSLKALVEEKFRRVDQQFGLVERQREEQKSDTSRAVDAAFSAAKDAVREQTVSSERAIAKSEEQTSKQLDQLGVNFTTAINGVTVLLGDLKERVGRIEYVKVGGKEAFTNIQVVLGLIVVLMVIGGFVAAAGGFGP